MWSIVRSFTLDSVTPIFARVLRQFGFKEGYARTAHPLGIELGPDDTIARYYVGHRLYDRFLPVLCRHLPNGWIVDVGANVGDTAVGIARETSNPILSVEASAEFYALLERNTAGLRVRCVHALVGTGRYGGQ